MWFARDFKLDFTAQQKISNYIMVLIVDITFIKVSVKSKLWSMICFAVYNKSSCQTCRMCLKRFKIQLVINYNHIDKSLHAKKLLGLVIIVINY